jgi:hypothetical protein
MVTGHPANRPGVIPGKSQGKGQVYDHKKILAPVNVEASVRPDVLVDASERRNNLFESGGRRQTWRRGHDSACARILGHGDFSLLVI